MKISKRELKKIRTAQKIKYYFFEREFNLTQTAKRIGVSRQTIYNYIYEYLLIDPEEYEKERERRKKEARQRKIEYIKNYIKNKRLQKRVELLKKEFSELLEKGIISESDIWDCVKENHAYLDAIVAQQHYKDAIYLSYEERHWSWRQYLPFETFARLYRYVGGGKYVRLDEVNGALVPTCLPKIIKSPNFAGRRRKGRTDITVAQEAIA